MIVFRLFRYHYVSCLVLLAVFCEKYVPQDNGFSRLHFFYPLYGPIFKEVSFYSWIFCASHRVVKKEFIAVNFVFFVPAVVNNNFHRFVVINSQCR